MGGVGLLYENRVELEESRKKLAIAEVKTQIPECEKKAPEKPAERGSEAGTDTSEDVRVRHHR